MGNWNQPCCETCWIEREGDWKDHGGGVEVLQGIRRPVMLRESQMERCSFCGRPTFVGIFVRANPADVPYPAKEPEDGS